MQVTRLGCHTKRSMGFPLAFYMDLGLQTQQLAFEVWFSKGPYDFTSKKGDR